MRGIQGSKYTPQKRTSHSHKKKLLDQVLAKDLYSPFKQTVATNLLASFTPLRKQPQYLLSPSPIKRDLFSQLLGTETKHHTPIQSNYSIMEQQDGSFEDIQEEDSEEKQISIDEQSEESENQANWSEDNGAKKRKRKSTVQIKLLKQELDGEMNWTKQKITRMAQVTGLSQSQVYKWCWDQKKKQNKGKQNYNSFGDRRKIIRKDLTYRNYLLHKNYNKQNENDSFCLKQQTNRQENYRGSLTKPKNSIQMAEQIGADTNKKVNKRLIFS